MKEKRPHLAAPEVYAIFCDTTELACFKSSSDILEEMDCNIEELLGGRGQKGLLEDLKRFSWDSFWFIFSMLVQNSIW